MEKLNKNPNIVNSSIKKDLKLIINNNSLITKKTKINKNKYKTDIKKNNTTIQPKTERETVIFNNLNNEENYSIEIDKEEEEEFNSDEYISSTMLDVDTNTYINEIEKKSDVSVSNTTNNKSKNVSPPKLNEGKNTKKFIKAICTNNNEHFLKNNKNNGSSNSSRKNNKNNNYYSSSPKLNVNDKNKDILYKKLKIQNIETINEKEKKQKTKKDLKVELRYTEKDKEKEKDNKNYSMIGYKHPLNIITNKDNHLKLDNTNINYTNLTKKDINPSKYGFKKIKMDINNLNIKLNEKNKTCKHKKSPTIINNNSINKNNNNIKDVIIMQKCSKINDKKYNKKMIISPKNNKIGIKSMKTLNTINAVNYIESPSISIPNNNNNKYTRIFYYNTNNNLIKNNNNNTININNNIINLNNIKNINQINHIIFSPLKKRLNKKINRNTTPTYRHNPFNSNSMSIEINNISNYRKNSNNKVSDKLLTYNFQDQKYLSRNKTFKNRRYLNNKNKFLNLLVNKKKMNIVCANDIINYQRNSKKKSPNIKNKINNFKKIKDNIIENQNQNFLIKNIGVQKYKNKNANNNLMKYSSLNSYSNRKQHDTVNNKHSLYKKGKKYNPNQFIYIKKENLSNIVQHSNKKNYDNNPFNKENQYIINKNISMPKSKKKYIKGEHSQNKDKELNGNLTSVNLIKTGVKPKKIKLEIGCKKKNKYRAKTLMEEDYLRDILINNKEIKDKDNNNENENDKDNYFKDYKYYKNNNKSISNNISLNQNNYNGTNYKCYERKTNNSPLSTKDITIKSPIEKHDINFNININMNNNDYKKLIYYYHAHNNSSINYSYMNKKERNSNLSYKPTKKKKENNLINETDFYKKRNSNDIFSNESKLNKKLENYSNYNMNNSNENNNINNAYNCSENTLNSFNNYIEECYDNFSTDTNKNNNNNNNTNIYISKKNKKQISKNKDKDNKNNNKINYTKKEKNIDNKNKIINNNNKKNEYIQQERNTTFTYYNFEQNNSINLIGNSNNNIKLSNHNSGNNHFYKINKTKKYLVNNNKQKSQIQKYTQGMVKKNEINEPNDDQIEGNLTSLDNYICNYYYENENINNNE